MGTAPQSYSISATITFIAWQWDGESQYSSSSNGISERVTQYGLWHDVSWMCYVELQAI